MAWSTSSSRRRSTGRTPRIWRSPRLPGGTRVRRRSLRVPRRCATPSSRNVRMLDEVDAITAVSGGSFTALAYGMYGEALFDQYERRYLKRNVQGELIARF